MSETFREPKPFRMETELIPADVDTALAGRRSALIEQWRNGELDAAAAFTALEHLYWQAQPTADDATRGYLRETAYMFPVEANMDPDVVDAIYLSVQEEY
jgi:tripartite-type tricarboxylate transporter receptor subunit TctC